MIFGIFFPRDSCHMSIFMNMTEGFRIESIQQTCLPFSIIYANQLKGAKTSLFEWFEYCVPFVNELNQNKFEKAKLELPL